MASTVSALSRRLSSQGICCCFQLRLPTDLSVPWHSPKNDLEIETKSEIFLVNVRQEKEI